MASIVIEPNLTPDQRAALDMLSRAADHGEPCPNNDAIAAEMGRMSPSSGSNVLRRLESKNFIQVKRYQMSRQVTICATGRSTAVPEFATPHWRDIQSGAAKPHRKRRTQTECRIANPPVPVNRDPCIRCGVRADLHAQWGCGK